MNICIEYNSKLVYESSHIYGHPVWPSPVLLQVVISSEDADQYDAPREGDLAPNSLIFREETYNSSSRVRRGRLYQANNQMPVEWRLYPHPALPDTGAGRNEHDGTYQKQVYAFSSIRLRPYLERQKIKHPIFILGAQHGFTIWTLVNIETSATGDEMLVLRARKSIGALPHLNTAKITDANGESVIEAVEILEEELYRAGPESVVDRSREAATAILSKYLQSIGKTNPGKDLSDLAKKVEAENLEVVASSAKIIARLHARGKHAEQEKRAPRRITEQDAEFAVQAVGTILCDLGWANW